MTRGRLLLLLLLGAALRLHAAPQVELHLPRDRASLRAGSTAEIEWSSATLPPGAEEWEAFLSVDGGRYYGYRITPHLDIERRRFTFEVPDFATADARILIRVGDEHDETELPLPGSFSIWRDTTTVPFPPLTIVDSERGEPGRAGAPGVVEWIEGDRKGRFLERRTALRRTSTLHEASIPHFHEEAVEGASDDATTDVAVVRDSRRVIPRGRAASAIPAIRARTGRDLLLVSRRLNL